MNIYHVSQDVNTGYDTFSDFVIIAESAEIARHTHPRGVKWDTEKRTWGDSFAARYTWTTPDMVIVTEIGESHTNEEQIVCSSFHAG